MRRTTPGSSIMEITRIVLDIEQGAQLRAGLNLSLGDSRGFGCAGGNFGSARQVQFDPEHTALPDSAFHAYGAPHQFDQPLAHH